MLSTPWLAGVLLAKASQMAKAWRRGLVPQGSDVPSAICQRALMAYHIALNLLFVGL